MEMLRVLQKHLHDCIVIQKARHMLFALLLRVGTPSLLATFRPWKSPLLYALFLFGTLFTPFRSYHIG